ncbi:hypothetical protein ACHQM5_001261 [Ranunculus cassubicifolius]
MQHNHIYAFFLSVHDEIERNNSEQTRDGSTDCLGRPADKARTGGWRSGLLLLVNQGLGALAFVGVEVNLVLFSTRVLEQTNAEAANTFSTWMGTVSLFSLVGAFLSDSYLGRYMTCVIFQVIFLLGLIMLSTTTYFSLLTPRGCGKIGYLCDSQTSLDMAVFYMSIYLIALGNGGYEPSLATLGADQFDEEDENEKRSKVSFFSYFYVALNLGSMISETVLAYFQNLGKWVMGFWISTGCGFIGLGVFLTGSLRYRHFKPCGNPLSRFSQVMVASFKKMKLDVPANGEGLYELHGNAGVNKSARKIHHTNDYKFLDRAAIISPEEMVIMTTSTNGFDPWCLCTVTQVEEVKCVLRLIPIWLCTIFYFLGFIQMISLFVEQGAAMNTRINAFHIPPASMTVFDIVSISTFIVFYDRLIRPYYRKITRNRPRVKGPSELQRMGIGIIFLILAMITAGIVEQQRRKYALEGHEELSSLHLFWQIPQYIILGVSEAFMYVAQLEFFAAQIPDALKSLGVGLSMSSTALGSYLTSMLLSLVMEITTKDGKKGWVPPNLNDGQMDMFFFLLAGLTSVNLVAFIYCAKRYKAISMEKRDEVNEAVTTLP